MKKARKSKEKKGFEGLTDIQAQAILLIASGLSYEAVSKKVNKNVGTIYKWLKNDRFKSELQGLRQRVRSEALQVLIDDIKEASCVMRKLLRDGKKPYIQRLVAKDIIDFYFKDIEMNEFDRRLTAIENKLKGGQK